MQSGPSAGLQSPQKKEKNMPNSPAFESHKRLPRMGLPRYSFIILQSCQANSDTIWVIINCSQRSAPAQLSSACSSLAYKTFKINGIMKITSVNYAILEGEEEGKQFPATSGGFLLPFPSSILWEKALHAHHVSSPEMGCGFNSASQKQTQGHVRYPCCHRRRHSACSTESPSDGGI